jgi:hypothetical protein
MREDVNMDEPLPAIDIAECLAKAVPVMLNDEDGAEPDDWHLMTLSHLVQVLAALPAEQLGAVINGLNASRAKLAPSPTPATPWPETASSEMDILLLADLAKEKARADRAEQIIGQLQAGGMRLELERAEKAEATIARALELAKTNLGYMKRNHPDAGAPTARELVAILESNNG